MTYACHKIVSVRRHGASTLALAVSLGAVLVWTAPAFSESATSGSSMGAQSGQQQGGGAAAQQQTGSGDSGSAQAGGLISQLPDRYKLSSWMGKKVTNGQGKTLGTVKDLVMDDLGLVRYVVLKSDLSGNHQKERLIAVPAGHFEYPLARKDNLVLDVTPGRMQEAPSFGASKWPNMGDQTFSSVIVAYWLPDESGNGQGGAAQAGDRGMGMRGASGDQGVGMSNTSGNRGMGMSSTAPDQGMGMSGNRTASAGQNPGTAGAMQRSPASDRPYDPNRDMIYLSQRKNQLFDQLDSNDNGVIDRDEARGNKRLMQQFNDVDTYANQGITRAEFAAFEIGDDSGMGAQSGQSSLSDQSSQSGQSGHSSEGDAAQMGTGQNPSRQR